MNYTFDNIGQWIEDLAKKPKATQFHTYARLVRENERQSIESAILNKFDGDNRHHGCKDVTVINDDMAIVTFTSTKGETHYIPVVNNKPSYVWFTTFEGALLGAISILKTGDESAAKYAGKILEVEM